MGVLDNIRRRATRVGKAALADRYPDLTSRQHLTSGTGQTPDAVQDYISAAQVYGVYTWVHKAVSVGATAIKALPVRHVDSQGKALSSFVGDLLVNPNDTNAPSDLWESCYVGTMLGGEMPLEVVPNKAGSQPAQIWHRRPDYVSILPDEARLAYPRAALYLYYDPDIIAKDARTAEERRKYALEIAPEWFIFDKFHNPLNKWRGLAPISAVRSGITIDLFAQAWSKTFLRRGARPDYAIVSKQPLTPNEKSALRDETVAQFSGPEGWHMPAVLDDGAEIQTFSFAPKDVEWLQQREFARDEVGAIFGVPDEVMGYGRDTYENFGAAFGVFWTLTLKPWCMRRDLVLTQYFRQRGWIKPTDSIATDYSSVGVLQEDDAPRVDKALKLWAMGVPFNVLDERLRLGVGAVPGGEIGYLPSGLTPADMITGVLPAETQPTTPQAPAQEARRMLPVMRRVNPDEVASLWSDDVLDDAARLADRFQGDD